MAEKKTVLAVLEFDCFPDLLLERTAWLARTFNLNVHLALYEPNAIIADGNRQKMVLDIRVFYARPGADEPCTFKLVGAAQAGFPQQPL